MGLLEHFSSDRKAKMQAELVAMQMDQYKKGAQDAMTAVEQAILSLPPGTTWTAAQILDVLRGMKETVSHVKHGG